ncbi:MAG TPA: transglutaminase-like domain-containing protein [Chloroflexota bacterium]
MAPVADPRAALAAALSGGDEALDLARVLLLIAAEERLELDVDAYLGRLDALADAIRPRLSGDEGPAALLGTINGYLYRELDFRGNTQNYQDPRNSFLNEVLDRRTGIPITLAAVYMEVAARLGHRLVGVNLPLHFMLAYETESESLIVDAFDRGRIMTAAEIRERLSQIAGREVELRPEHFGRASRRMIVRRVLNNLRGIYLAGRDYPRALAVIERMELVLPTADVLRDRGLVLYRLRRHEEAELALRQYLERAPGALDRRAVEQHLDWLRRMRAEMS